MTDDEYSYEEYPQDEMGGYEEAGDGSAVLPDDHWAMDSEYLQWIDNFAAQLRADEALLEKFNEFIGSLGEPGEQEAAVEPSAQEANGWTAPKVASRPLDSPDLQQAARNFLRGGRAQGRR